MSAATASVHVYVLEFCWASKVAKSLQMLVQSAGVVWGTRGTVGWGMSNIVTYSHFDNLCNLQKQGDTLFQTLQTPLPLVLAGITSYHKMG